MDLTLSIVVGESLFGPTLTERAVILLTCQDALTIRDASGDHRTGRDDVRRWKRPAVAGISTKVPDFAHGPIGLP